MVINVGTGCIWPVIVSIILRISMKMDEKGGMRKRILDECNDG